MAMIEETDYSGQEQGAERQGSDMHEILPVTILQTTMYERKKESVCYRGRLEGGRGKVLRHW